MFSSIKKDPLDTCGVWITMHAVEARLRQMEQNSRQESDMLELLPQEKIFASFTLLDPRSFFFLSSPSVEFGGIPVVSCLGAFFEQGWKDRVSGVFGRLTTHDGFRFTLGEIQRFGVHACIR